MAEPTTLVTPVAADPIAAIDRILAAENPQPEKPAPSKAAPAVDPQSAGEEQPVEAEQEPEQEPEAEPAPNRQVEGDDAEPSKATAEIPLEQVEAIELEVTTKGEDGKDVSQKLPVSELKKGYMRQADYQRKTAEVARQREELGTKTRQAIESERTQALAQIQQLQALVMETVAPELQGTDLNRLATDDPFEYVKRRNRLDQITQTLQKIQGAQQELTAKQKAEAEAKHKETIARARETLQTEIPGWNDVLYQQLMKDGETFGYKADEIAQWVDPRAIKLLHAAVKGRAATPQKPSADKRLVAVPKAMKPGASAEQSVVQQRRAKALEQHRKTGTVDSAAAAIAALMK